MNRKSIYWGIILSVILSSLIFILGLDRKDYSTNPGEVYQVYLNGEVIGVIEDEEELYNLIDEEQKHLKKEYDVKKIYAPLGLKTTKLITYEGNVDSVNVVYNKVKDVEPFTVKGYEVTIVENEDNIITLNVLNKKIFDDAIDITIKAFVDDEDYENYLNNKQEKIVTTGKQITNIYLKEKVTIKEKYLSTEDKIYTNATDLSKYILFGTEETQGTHIVKMGETIKDIADEHQLNVKEFLIVNPEIISENSLLFSGQVVNVGLVDPIVSVVVEDKLVQDMKVAYEKEVRWDTKLAWGTTFTEQFGQDGTTRVGIETETINGVITRVEKKSEETIVPVIKEIIVKGGVGGLGDGYWIWPTLRPYVLTDAFGWRWHPIDGTRKFHKGLDISGTGYASPIFAAQAGTITRIGYDNWGYGNIITIKHNDMYSTIYAHLAYFADNLRVGSTVEAGEVIGFMGSSGNSTGTHLHYEVVVNGEEINPFLLYQ